MSTPAGRWVETVLVTLLGLGLCLVLRPQDPFFLQSREPWLLLLPLLCGVQHGLAHAAVSSSLVMLLAILHGGGLAQADPSLLWSWSVVSLFAGAIVGHFRDARELRHRHLLDRLSDSCERLERSTRAERALRLSHAKLEDCVATARWSLVGTLEDAARRMKRRATRRDLGEVVLETLASHAMVQSAALYEASSGELQASALAAFGDLPTAAGLSPLVTRACTQRQLLILDPASAARSGEDAHTLAALPLLTSRGVLLGVVAIHQMAFITFQPSQLRQLAEITCQLADLMNDRMCELDAACEIGEIAIEEGELTPAAAEVAADRVQLAAAGRTQPL